MSNTPSVRLPQDISDCPDFCFVASSTQENQPQLINPPFSSSHNIPTEKNHWIQESPSAKNCKQIVTDIKTITPISSYSSDTTIDDDSTQFNSQPLFSSETSHSSSVTSSAKRQATLSEFEEINHTSKRSCTKIQTSLIYSIEKETVEKNYQLQQSETINSLDELRGQTKLTSSGVSEKSQNMETTNLPKSTKSCATGSNASSVLPDETNGRTVDADLYSRQIGAYGFETMNRLLKMNVIVSGLRGVGVETAKNLILAGPARVTLHDDSLVELRDLASNFYATEENVKNKATRAEACFDHLSSLNDYVTVDVHSGPIDTILNKYTVGVFSNIDRSSLVRYNNICRTSSPPVGFVYAEAYGVAATIFVDFGPEFTVNNKDGEDPYSAIVAGVTYESPATVHIHNEKPMPFQNGDFVTFKEIQGMTELNGSEPRKIKVTGKHSFTIEDTTKYTPYNKGGIVEQVKVPEVVSFSSFEDRCVRPVNEGNCLPMPDLGKFGRSEQLHFAFIALLEWQDAHGGKLPNTRNETAVQDCVAIARRLNESAKKHSSPVVVDEVDEKVVGNVVRFASANISPMTSFVGGVAAQEIVKFTGRYTPINQWIHFDCFELLQKEDTKDYHMDHPSRYSDQIGIWGSQFQKRLGDLKVFLVGAGALGCEMLKAFALMGFCVNSCGNLTVTDMDSIETSNLNRQFLFRRQHVGKEKSTIAASAAKDMNGAMNVRALNVRVGEETESTFNDPFWEGLDVVVNALDNVPSRLYIDSCCVWYCKPLVESGTLGTKANVQVVVPKLTESYGDSQDPPEESIPLCTLKHFPHEIEHTIEWARDTFQGLFTDGPQQTIAFLKNPDAYLHRIECDSQVSQQREKLENIKSLLKLALGPDESQLLSRCISAALLLFHDYFNIQISQLLHNFPLDHVSSNGVPFWSGPKRPPHLLNFNSTDSMHIEFVRSTACIFAFCVGIQSPSISNEAIAEIASKSSFKKFVPRQVRIKVDENDSTVDGANDDEDAVALVTKDLMEYAQNTIPASIQSSEFEKDDDTNFHIDFIWSCANLRARNYSIEECDRHKAKMISGRIIPAIATTTAMVTGLVSLEVLKTITPKRPIEEYRNAFVNLGLPIWLFSEPLPPAKTVAKDYDPIACGPVRTWPAEGFTTWDRIDLKIKNGTLEMLIKEIETIGSCDAAIVSIGNCCLYNSYLPAHKSRLKEPVKELYEKISKTKLPKGRGYLACELSCCSKKDGVDIILPVVKFIFE